MQTATVQIGRFELKLSPLKRSYLPGARKAFHALAVAQFAAVASAPWFRAHSDALGFIFIAAKGNHRGLSLTELDDEAEPQEIVSAFKALAQICEPVGAWGRFGKRVCGKQGLNAPQPL